MNELIKSFIVSPMWIEDEKSQFMIILEEDPGIWVKLREDGIITLQFETQKEEDMLKELVKAVGVSKNGKPIKLNLIRQKFQKKES